MDRLLQDGWREHLTALQLRDVAAVAKHYTVANARVAPDTQSLAEVLRGLKSQSPAAKTWWQTVKEWWQDWLSRSDSALARWLRQIAGHVDVSQGILRAVAYCLTALVAIGALALVARELRLWNRRRQEKTTEHAPLAAREDLMSKLPAPVGPSSAEEQLSRLLRTLVLRLLETGRLSADRSLTHRELARRSRFDDDEQRGAFTRVTQVAEALLYGPRGAAQSQIPQAIERGEALLARLRAVAA
jgi:hypothetical protein